MIHGRAALIIMAVLSASWPLPPDSCTVPFLMVISPGRVPLLKSNTAQAIDKARLKLLQPVQ